MNKKCTVCNGSKVVLHQDWEEWDRIINERAKELKIKGELDSMRIALEEASKVVPNCDPIIPCHACR